MRKEDRLAIVPIIGVAFLSLMFWICVGVGFWMLFDWIILG